MELFSTLRAKDARALPLASSSSTRKISKDTAATISSALPAHDRAFTDLGLCDWACKSASAMGFRHPTEIQRLCIPAILQGRDVLGCAETGSGKTGAFALPILHHLSQDPFGVFAVILTPTRELAIQISEQFSALGAPMSLRVCLIIGGIGMTEQSLQLSKRPHIVIATPGRLRHHLGGPDPPNLSKANYLVLDEADRLFASGFSSELQVILTSMNNKKRRTLLFSATLSASLVELEQFAMKETLRFDLTTEQRIPTQLIQQYLFVPAQIKVCYLMAVLQKILPKDDDRNGGTMDKKGWMRSEKAAGKRRRIDDSSSTGENGGSMPSSSIIIFVGTCRRCQEITEILTELGLDCVALHSMMSQLRRIAALGKFKSHLSRILIATDIASRGLDIPTVDIVINMDLPKVAVDYVHRIGRTARAGRQGRSLSLITQYDVGLVHEIEAYTGHKMALSEEVKETEVLPLLNPVAKAIRMAQLKLLEVGFEDKAAVFAERKKGQRRKVQKDLVENA